jgi:FkbM family methyltransferase
MYFLNTARQFVNDLLSPIGLAIIRTDKTPWKWVKSDVTVRIGQYAIQVSTLNPVAWHYSHTPDLISQLGRLVPLLKRKYPGFAAIDVGANVGDTACIIKSAADIPLLCIEGDEFSFGYLQKNIAQFRNTTAHKLFLGEKTGIVSAVIQNAGWNLTLKPGTGASASSIKLTSLDDFLATQPAGPAFKLLKIDTEGFDCRIIRGTANYIQKAMPVITFEYNRGNMDAIGELGLPTLFKLREFGYSRVVFHDQNGRLLLATALTQSDLVKDLHEYADCVRGRIGYLDITVFHTADNDVAEEFIQAERANRGDPVQDRQTPQGG